MEKKNIYYHQVQRKTKNKETNKNGMLIYQLDLIVSLIGVGITECRKKYNLHAAKLKNLVQN